MHATHRPELSMILVMRVSLHVSSSAVVNTINRHGNGLWNVQEGGGRVLEDIPSAVLHHNSTHVHTSIHAYWQYVLIILRLYQLVLE